MFPLIKRRAIITALWPLLSLTLCLNILIEPLSTSLLRKPRVRTGCYGLIAYTWLGVRSLFNIISIGYRDGSDFLWPFLCLLTDSLKKKSSSYFFSNFQAGLVNLRSDWVWVSDIFRCLSRASRFCAFLLLHLQGCHLSMVGGGKQYLWKVPNDNTRRQHDQWTDTSTGVWKYGFRRVSGSHFPNRPLIVSLLFSICLALPLGTVLF